MKLHELSTHRTRLKRARDMGFDTDTIWYHGSPVKFDSFGRQKTSYGFFVTHDPDTAMNYSDDVQGEHGTGKGYMYRVVLKLNKVLDITEGIPMELAREMLHSEPEYNTDEAYKFITDMHKNNVREVVEWIASFADEDIDNKDVDDILNLEMLDGDEIHDWIKSTNNTKLLSNFEDRVEEKWEEYEWLQDAVGTNSFYMDYQNDLLHAAERLDYDAVDMVDPSSTGEPYSRAVFDGDNIFIISRKPATADIEDEISSRF